MITSYYLLSAALLVALTGCEPHRVLSCDVIDTQSTELQSDLYDLPLSADARTKLTKALKFGLNKRNEADDIAVIPNAEWQYKDLLDLLSRLKAPARNDLNTPEFKKVFPGDRVLGVRNGKQQVDAVAAKDQDYWWLIYPGGASRHSRVMVMKLSACNTLDEGKR